MKTPVGLFEEQMAFLVENGYRVEDSREVVRQLREGEPLNPKTVILTFDDGFEDAYTLALPVLRKYRFPATLFLIGCTSSKKGHLSVGQLKEMRREGLLQFGCHGLTHRRLRGLSEEDLREETLGARRRLEDALGDPIELFAYPFGSYGSWGRAARVAVERAGFLGGFTSVFGAISGSSDRFLLRRSRVSWCNRVADFDRLLKGGYDWYAFLQRLQSPL
jgi:peptidoglycan/xylan/chitin deacetylase (PgdA/CDA1 family)